MKDFNGNTFRPPEFKYHIKDSLNIALGSIGIEKPTLIPDEYDRLIFFLLDGFGYRTMNSLGVLEGLEMPFFEFGSTLPSVTPSALASISTGKDVAEHGVLGVKFWLPELGAPFSPLGFFDLGSGLPADFPPEALMFEEPISRQLADDGFKPFAVLPSSVEGGLSHALYQGSRAYFVDGLGGMHFGLSRFLRSRSRVCFAYWEFPDTHLHGGYPVESIKVELASIFSMLRRLGGRAARRTCLVLLGDHGSTRLDGSIDLGNLRPLMHLDPLGSSRSRILHVRDRFIEPVARAFHNHYVFEPHRFFRHARDDVLERAGNLLVFPSDGTSLADGSSKKVNSHGSVLPDELSTAFGFTRLSEFQYRL